MVPATAIQSRRTQKGVENARVTREEISPARAQEWLEHNVGNRSVSEAQVDAIARDMHAGRWQLNGATIVFALSGRLLDGQHRLLACVKSGATIESFVAWDLPDPAMKSIDTGRVRRIGDLLRLNEGTANAMHCAAIARTIGAIEQGSPEARAVKRLTYSEVSAIYRRYSKDITPIFETIGNKIEPGIPSGGAQVIGPLAFMRGLNPDKVDAFAERFANGQTADGDPAHALRKAVGAIGSRGSPDRRSLLARTLRAIEAELSKERMLVVKVDSSVFERAILARLGKRRSST